MDNCYAHTIKISGFEKIDFIRLENIFQTGYLLSRRNLRFLVDNTLDISEETAVYNGMDYISLCDLNMNHSGYSSYNMYTRRGLSLLIDHSIEVIKPTLVDKAIYDYWNIRDLDVIEKRFTDLKDEVQVKDKISLKYLKGICLARSTFLSLKSEKYLEYYLNYLDTLIEDYGYNVPVYDLDSEEKIKINKKYHKIIDFK